MTIAYDMAALPPSSRLRIFREMLASSLKEGSDALDYSFMEEDFTARVKGNYLGAITWAEATTSGHVLDCTAANARRSAEECLLLGFNLDTPLQAVQDDRNAILGTGDFAFLNTARAYRSTTRLIGRRIYLQIPKEDLVRRLGPIDDFTATTFSAKLSMQRQATNFFVQAAATLDQLDRILFEQLLGQGLDLLAYAMSEQLGEPLRNTTVYASAFLTRLKTFIVTRLRDPELSLAMTAAAFRVSPRYINILLANEHTSFGRFVLSQRLAGCRRDLENPARLFVSVSDIAFSWGFNDAAHFSRAFRTRFECSPRDYREAHLRKAA